MPSKIISPLLHFNVKSELTASSKLRHVLPRETTVPEYVGLKFHNEFRDRNLIDSLYKLGISITTLIMTPHLQLQKVTYMVQEFH